MHHRARVETVLRAEPGGDLVAVVLLDRALDDDVQLIGGGVALDDDFAGPEIADIEGGAQIVDLAVAQAIERRIMDVERLRHWTAHSCCVSNDFGCVSRTQCSALARRKTRVNALMAVRPRAP